MRDRRTWPGATVAALARGLAALPAAATRRPASARRSRPRLPRPEAVIRRSRARRTARRPTDDPDPNRNAYRVPEAPQSPACGPHFCVHWVAEGLDAPDLTDGNADGMPDYVERVLRVAEHVHAVENGKLGWREPSSDGRSGGGERQDRHLPLADRRPAVRLRGPRPRPGDQGAPDPAPPARLPGARQRLQRLRVPRHEAARTTSR